MKYLPEICRIPMKSQYILYSLCSLCVVLSLSLLFLFKFSFRQFSIPRENGFYIIIKAILIFNDGFLSEVNFLFKSNKPNGCQRTYHRLHSRWTDKWLIYLFGWSQFTLSKAVASIRRDNSRHLKCTSCSYTYDGIWCVHINMTWSPIDMPFEWCFSFLLVLAIALTQFPIQFV